MVGYLNKICCKFTSESDSEKKLKSVNIWESYGQEFGVLFLTHGVVLLVLFTKLIRWTGRKRLVTQPGGQCVQRLCTGRYDALYVQRYRQTTGKCDAKNFDNLYPLK